MPRQLPASQHTPPVQLGAPVQLTLQAEPSQATRAQELTPPQLIVVNVDLLVTSALQARAPAQSTAQLLPLQAIG